MTPFVVDQFNHLVNCAAHHARLAALFAEQAQQSARTVEFWGFTIHCGINHQHATGRHVTFY